MSEQNQLWIDHNRKARDNAMRAARQLRCGNVREVYTTRQDAIIQCVLIARKANRDLVRLLAA